MLDTYPIPSKGFLRLTQIIGKPKANPPQQGVFPVSASTWWSGVKSGKYPAPVKLSESITAWRAEDIIELIESINNQGEAHEI